jgi:hypothetical protein
MYRNLILLLVLSGGAALPADDPKANTLTPQEIADGWIMLFDGEATFGWKVNGEVKVANGVLTLGGQQESSIETTTVFGRGDIRVSYRCSGFHPATIHWRGEQQLFGQSTGVATLCWEPGTKDPPHSTIRFNAPAGAALEIRAITLHPKGLTPMFSGKDLSGWKVFPGERYPSKFTVTPEGWLNVQNGPGDLQTERQWADFVFQGQCISNGQHLNSGIFFRCIPNQ